MFRKICVTKETHNSDGICDDCKVKIVSNDYIPYTF